MNKKRMMGMVVIMVGLAAVAFAQTPQTSDTGSVQLIGSVAKRVQLTVTGQGDFQALNLMTDVTDFAVATVTEFSNVRAGYTVSLESASAVAGGSAQPYFDGGAGDDTLSYSIKYADVPVSFTGGAAATITDAADKTPLAGTSKTVTISYTGTAVNIYDGTYSDTLTFTITAK